MTAVETTPVIEFVASSEHHLKPFYFSSSGDLTVKTAESESISEIMALSTDCPKIVFHRHGSSHLNLVEHSDTSTSGGFDAGLDIDGSDNGDNEAVKKRMGFARRGDPDTAQTFSSKCMESPKNASPSPVLQNTTDTRAGITFGSPRIHRPVSIMKAKVRTEPRYINNNQRSWRSLPQADVDSILQHQEQQNFRNKSSPPQPTRRHSVSFDSIKIRFYSQTVGDNPSCSYGTPIQLDWDYEQCDGVTVEEYETNRGKRRNLRQLVLSCYHRHNILSWQYGIPDDELKQAQKQADKIKLKRAITKTLLPVMPFESAIEMASRRAKQLVKSTH
jgi:hypothetical protein